MRPDLAQNATNAIGSPKMALGASGVTMWSGWSDKLTPFIPSNVAEICAVIGATLSLVLIIVQVVKLVYWLKENKLRREVLMRNLGRRKKVR